MLTIVPPSTNSLLIIAKRPYRSSEAIGETTLTTLTGPIEELLESEKAYLGSLIHARDEFFPQLRQVVSAGEAKALFGGWEALIGGSQQLLQAMDDPT